MDEDGGKIRDVVPRPSGAELVARPSGAELVARPSGAEFELLAAWRNGDREAGSTLLERQFDMLYRFFRTKAAVEDVRELIQATLLRCVEHRDAFLGHSRFSTYVYAVARSVLVAHYRERARQEAFDPAVSSIADVDPSPSSVMVEHERERLLLQALRSIPLDHQVLLELHYWERLTGPELALALEVPEGTVRTRLRRAKQLLQQAWNELASAGRRGPFEREPSDADLDAWAESLRGRLHDTSDNESDR